MSAMTHQKSIYTYISSIAISLCMLLASIPANAKGKDGSAKNDSVPLFNGFAVSVDLVGPVQMLIGDYGQYEAALRIIRGRTAHKPERQVLPDSGSRNRQSRPYQRRYGHFIQDKRTILENRR